MRGFLFFILLFGSALYWAGMNEPSYGQVRVETTLIQFGLFKTCTGTVGSDNTYNPTCNRYEGLPLFISTSVALYGVWIFFDILILILLAYSPCLRIRNRNRNKIFVYNIVMAILSFFAFIFLWASFIYFSSKLKQHNDGLKYGSGFGAAISGFFVLTFIYFFMFAFPIVAERLDFNEDDKETAQAPPSYYFTNANF
ncbi:hypothetical protein GJ496_002422 [Pomphorhynchus laevis]|nr:hypothetical protein GJ496_002422 [Pomphorhynchus laevis]